MFECKVTDKTERSDHLLPSAVRSLETPATSDQLMRLAGKIIASTNEIISMIVLSESSENFLCVEAIYDFSINNNERYTYLAVFPIWPDELIMTCSIFL